MNSCVVVWFDCEGRYRAKGYIYEECARKFAVKLLTDCKIPYVGVEFYEHGKRVRSMKSKGARV